MSYSPRLPLHGVHPMFLTRHSPRSFTDRALSEAEVLSLIEAARWAPSASNNQPWRLAWALRGTPEFDAIAAGLKGFNAVWAPKASALFVIGSRSVVVKDGAKSPVASHAFDAGASWMSLALQAETMGLRAHAMGGIDKALLARAVAAGPDDVIHAVIAVGEQGPADALPEEQRAREVPSGRKPLEEIAARGRFPG